MHINPANYSLPVVMAVALHLGISALFLFEWQAATPPQKVPEHIVARVIAVENQAEKQRKEKHQQQVDRQKRVAAEKARKQKQADLAKRKAIEKKKAAEKKAEQQRKLALKKAEEAKKAAQETARLEKEAQQQAEQEARELAVMEQQMLEKLAQEEAAEELVRQQEAERRAKLAARIETEYLARIRDQISSSWVYPPGVDPEQEVEVELTVVPTGEVLVVTILNGSSNQALDRSVEQAIYNASPLPVPDDIRIFDASFRQFRMKFRPENATW